MTILYIEPEGRSTGRNKEKVFFPRSREGTAEAVPLVAFVSCAFILYVP